MTRQMSLTVNDNPIQLDYFVSAFIDHTAAGMIESLENTEAIRSLDLTIDADIVTVVLNNKPLEINKFVMKIMKSTVSGMVAPLKGVSQPVNKVALGITR